MGGHPENAASSQFLRGDSPSGYPAAMKTAVSLPDDVYPAAERQARRTRKSRSQLYAEALSEYLARHAPDEVTGAMHSVVDRLKDPTGCAGGGAPARYR